MCPFVSSVCVGHPQVLVAKLEGRTGCTIFRKCCFYCNSDYLEVITDSNPISLKLIVNIFEYLICIRHLVCMLSV